ncbi:MAG: hypothetical protein AB7I01_17395 [Gammaproteobacteria bacterium]
MQVALDVLGSQSHRCLVRTLWATLLACRLTGADAAPPYFDAEVSYVHDDNLGRAARGRDTVDDDALLARGGVNWLAPLSAQSGLRAGLGASYQRQARWSDLSRAEVQGDLVFRHKPFATYAGPWFEVALAGAVSQFQDSALRDGGRVSSEFATGSALTDSLALRLGYRYTLQRAWREAVFDGDQHRVYLNVDARVAEMTVYGTVGWQHGDVVSVSGDGALPRDSAIAQAADPAFSDGRHPRTAYRLEADTWTAAAGFNLPLAAGLAFDASVGWFDADADAGARYRGWRVMAGLLFRR